MYFEMFSPSNCYQNNKPAFFLLIWLRFSSFTVFFATGSGLLIFFFQRIVEMRSRTMLQTRRFSVIKLSQFLTENAIVPVSNSVCLQEVKYADGQIQNNVAPLPSNILPDLIYCNLLIIACKNKFSISPLPSNRTENKRAKSRTCDILH